MARIAAPVAESITSEVELVVSAHGQRIEVARADERDLAVGDRGLGVDHHAFPLVDPDARVEEALVDAPCRGAGERMVVAAGQQDRDGHAPPRGRFERREDLRGSDHVGVGDLERRSRARREPLVDRGDPLGLREVLGEDCNRRVVDGSRCRSFGRCTALRPPPHRLERPLDVACDRSSNEQGRVAPAAPALLGGGPIITDAEPADDGRLPVDGQALAVIAMAHAQPAPRRKRGERQEGPRRHPRLPQDRGDGAAADHHRADRVIEDADLDASTGGRRESLRESPPGGVAREDEVLEEDAPPR